METPEEIAREIAIHQSMIYKHEGIQTEHLFSNIKEAIAAERARAQGLIDALEFLSNGEPENGDKAACTFCDMGGSGYSSQGDGHHDDVKHICPVYRARQALADFRGEKV